MHKFKPFSLTNWILLPLFLHFIRKIRMLNPQILKSERSYPISPVGNPKIRKWYDVGRGKIFRTKSGNISSQHDDTRNWSMCDKNLFLLTIVQTNLTVRTSKSCNSILNEGIKSSHCSCLLILPNFHGKTYEHCNQLQYTNVDCITLKDMIVPPRIDFYVVELQAHKHKVSTWSFCF